MIPSWNYLGFQTEKLYQRPSVADKGRQVTRIHHTSEHPGKSQVLKVPRWKKLLIHKGSRITSIWFLNSNSGN